MRRLAAYKKVVAISVAAMLSLVLLMSATLPSMVTAQDNQAETVDRVAKNKQYLEKTRNVLENKTKAEDRIAEYKQLKNNIDDESEKEELNKIKIASEEVEQLNSPLRQLEELNMKLYQVDPELEQRIYAVQKTLSDKYVDPQSATYTVASPVELVMADVLTRSVILIVNPDKAAPDGSNVPTEGVIDGIPVRVSEGEVKESSCTSDLRINTCRPIWSGVSVKEKTAPPNSLNTAGYKAVKSTNNGFIIAGHTAVANGREIVQPHTSSSRVGLVDGFCQTGSLGTSTSCDFAFVKADAGITVDNQACRGSTTTCTTSTYTVVSKTPDSQQTLGTFVIKVSANGASIGDVRENSSAVKYNLALTNSCIGGDSGSAVFYETGGNARIFGVTSHCLNVGGNMHTLYWPWDYVNTRIGAVPTVPNS